MDARNEVKDRTCNVHDLIPHKPRIELEACRSFSLVNEYWSNAVELELSSQVVGGCEALHGYTEAGDVLLEKREDLIRLKVAIGSVFFFAAVDQTV